MAEAGTPRDALEEHASMQGVGVAPAEKPQVTPPETPEKIQGEQTLNPEQQRLAENFDNYLAVAKNKIVQARTEAGLKLQNLKGTDLVKAGFKQVLFGAIAGAVAIGLGSTLGALSGGVVGAQVGMIRAGATLGMFGGVAVGEIATNKMYDIGTKRRESTKLKWYDWVGGNLGELLPQKLQILRLTMNPMTFSGFRHMTEGFIQMAKNK